MKDKECWFVEVYDCGNVFIVEARTKEEAKDKVYRYLNKLYPAKDFIERGYRPYYKKDVRLVVKLSKCMGSDGIMSI